MPAYTQIRDMADFNHMIVWARDKQQSAAFLADILGTGVSPQFGPFIPVKVNNGVTLDFIDSPDPHMQHLAFLVSDSEFDSAFAKLQQRGIAYWANPDHTGKGEINRHYGGRGVYFEDPSGHWLELITKPYGDALPPKD